VNSSIIDQIDAEIARLKTARKRIARTIEASTSDMARVEARTSRRVRGSGARERMVVRRSFNS
jgi:hypothetical protein